MPDWPQTLSLLPLLLLLVALKLLLGWLDRPPTARTEHEPCCCQHPCQRCRKRH